MSVERRRAMIEAERPKPAIRRQCELVGLRRSAFYGRPKGESPLNLLLMRLVDEQYLATPWYGSRQMARHLVRQGHAVGRKRIRRLMAKMSLVAVYQRPRTTIPHQESKIWPYLLRDLTIERPDHVWCADITYIPMRRGFMYLVAIMDWASRRVLSWRLSNTMETEFCIEALQEAMARHGKPEIFNTDPSAGSCRRSLRESDERPPCLSRIPIHQRTLHRGLDHDWRPGVDGRTRPLDG